MPPSATIFSMRDILAAKPALQAVYTDYFRRIGSLCIPGSVLEIGAGGAGLGHHADRVVMLDIQHAPWVDVVADAQLLPFGAASFDNIAMLDVLHHLASPRQFFHEAVRVLRPGGRIVMMEPAITPLIWPLLKLFHHEPVRLDVDPLGDHLSDARDPADANMAIPTLLFRRFRTRFAETFPALRIGSMEYLSLWAYPLSGGYRAWSLLPVRLVRPVLRLEELLLPVLGRIAGFRLLVVIERQV